MALGESQAGLGYTGEHALSGAEGWFDTDVGLEYLRARWYQPGTGRFTSRDPLVASSFYLYASNNPITRIDPTGYIDWLTCVIQGDYGACTIWESCGT